MSAGGNDLTAPTLRVLQLSTLSAVSARGNDLTAPTVGFSHLLPWRTDHTNQSGSALLGARHYFTPRKSDKIKVYQLLRLECQGPDSISAQLSDECRRELVGHTMYVIVNPPPLPVQIARGLAHPLPSARDALKHCTVTARLLEFLTTKIEERLNMDNKPQSGECS